MLPTLTETLTLLIHCLGILGLIAILLLICSFVVLAIVNHTGYLQPPSLPLERLPSNLNWETLPPAYQDFYQSCQLPPHPVWMGYPTLTNTVEPPMTPTNPSLTDIEDLLRSKFPHMEHYFCNAPSKATLKAYRDHHYRYYYAGFVDCLSYPTRAQTWRSITPSALFKQINNAPTTQDC